jgi:hypothetical protein
MSEQVFCDDCGELAHLNGMVEQLRKGLGEVKLAHAKERELSQRYWTYLNGAEQERNELAAYAERLRGMVNAARDSFIERHSDGETDCVTPYDIYTAPPTFLQQRDKQVAEDMRERCAVEIDNHKMGKSFDGLDIMAPNVAEAIRALKTGE